MEILIIDDEESVRDSVRFALEADDHYVEAIDNGKTGLLRLKEDPFDLVILDLNLGEESGLDILSEMRKRHPRTPVVMFTAEATIDSAVKAIQSGAMDYLEKPFTPDQLRSVVARSRNWRQMQEKIEELEVEISTQSPPAIFESRDQIMSDSLDVLFRAA